ncbi:MAG: ATP-binding cassette domain-containing protein [Bacteroidia bacterium]|nr:ATP-binding cassette domain-containing protein [Bacteroidia bacterium]
MANNILDIKGISKHYTDKTALSNVSIEIPKACIYGLLGPNGAGKTSLIRIINQITAADEGEVLFNGSTLGPEHIQKIGYLPEERGLYKKVKVIDQLTYFGKLRGLTHREALERAHWWLKKMDLFDIRNKRIEEFSKGMQQKVQFIVAVIHEPELLILDEPFSGFDPVNAELLTNIILEMKQKGVTIIFSTHRMESVEKLCDYMALIHQSKKILDGKVTEIKQRYRTDKFELVSEKPIQFNHPGVELLSSGTTDSGYPMYTVKINQIKNNELIDYAMKQSELLSFNLYMPSIHDIFIQSVN